MHFIRSFLFLPLSSRPALEVLGCCTFLEGIHGTRADVGQGDRTVLKQAAVDPQLTPQILTACILASSELSVEDPESVAHACSVDLPNAAPTALT